MTATTTAYLVISQNPNNSELDCIDEFDSFTEACEFAEEFGGELVNAYARNWTTAQCEKAKQLAAEAMRNGAQQDAPEVPAQPEAQPAPAANMITCPKTETQVSDWTCSDCEQRAGCPAWAE